MRRSIAEIIGLDAVRQLCFGPDGELLRPPTVDDLLVWLGQQGLAWDADGGAGQIVVSLARRKGDSVYHVAYFGGATLLEALEAAVRTVAEHES